MNRIEEPSGERRPSPWLSLAEVAALLTISKRTLQKWVKAGRFPPPVGKTAKWRRWHRDAIDRLMHDWQDSRPTA
jgi:excisionase family DNA binding protein